MEHGAYELAEALSVNKFLVILNLTGNAIGNEGLSYLLPAIVQSNTLISLNLTSNEIVTGPVRQSVLKNNQRLGYTHSFVRDRNWASLKPFKFQFGSTPTAECTSNAAADDESERKRYKLQSAHLIKEFI